MLSEVTNAQLFYHPTDLFHVFILTTCRRQFVDPLLPARREDEDVKEIRWMIEELRVSYFAQQLGTPYPISDKRILQAMEQISG